MALIDNLISYWKLDGNSSDSLGVNNGTDTSMSYSTGKIGNAGDFNGTSSFIGLTTSASLKPTGSITLSFWIKGGTSATRRYIFQSYSQVSTVAGFLVHITQSSGEGGNENKIRFVVGANTGFAIGTQYQQVFSSSTVTDNNWHHIVCKYDGTNISVSVDNGTPSTASWTSGIGYTATSYQRIGCSNISGTNTEFFSSQIDEIGLWSSALSSTEITELYNGGLGNSYPFQRANFFMFL